VAVQIQLRRDTAANWTSVNTLLAQGEVGLELDTGKFKIGDGATHWTGLPYYAGPGDVFAPPVITKTADYVVRASDNQTTFDNGGATGLVVFSLPPAAAGLRYSFIVVSTQIIEVLADSGDSIAIGANIGSVGGSAQSDVPYSLLSLIVPSGGANQWVAGGALGSWTLD
jgi:hypothetical protein